MSDKLIGGVLHDPEPAPAATMPADDAAKLEHRTRMRGELLNGLARAINETSTENASNTPDFILANFAAACLDAFAEASLAREAWYGKSLSIVGEPQPAATTHAVQPVRYSEFLSEGCFPEAPLELRPGANFKPTRDLDAVLPPAPTAQDALIAEAREFAARAGRFEHGDIVGLATYIEELADALTASERLSNARAKNIDELHDALTAERAERVAADQHDYRKLTCMGVGDGSGQLFVYGNYESIKAAQNKLLARDAAIARAERAERERAETAGSLIRCRQTFSQELDTLRTQLAEAREQLAACASNTTAVDLVEKMEFLKAERDDIIAALGYGGDEGAWPPGHTIAEAIVAMRRESGRFASAIRWALGQEDDFPDRKDGQGAYWWRTELRMRAGVLPEKEVNDATQG